MNTTFCDNCDNLMYTYTNADNKLYNGCKVCGNKQDISNDESCVYKTDYEIDISNILNTNKNISNDVTLPKIKNNPNIKCINTECASKNKDSSITYIKYDEDNMKYLYICDNCGQSWTNVNKINT